MKEKFKIKGNTIELLKLLKASGLCDTGGMAKNVINDGLVMVNGKVEFLKRKKLIKGEKIEFNNHTIIIE